MPCRDAVSLPLRGLKSCLGGIVHPGAGLRTGSSKKSVISSVGTGRRRIRDPVLPPLPQRCPPRGHRARGRRSFGMDAGGRVQRTKAVHPVPSPRPFSGAFCGRIRALHVLPHAPWPSIPNSRTAENGPGVFVAPVGFAVPTLPDPLLPLRPPLPMLLCCLSGAGEESVPAGALSPGSLAGRDGRGYLAGGGRDWLFCRQSKVLLRLPCRASRAVPGFLYGRMAAVIRAAEISRRGLCCQAFSCSCRSPFAFCPLLCLCGLFWRSVLHPCLDLSADLYVPAANCLAYAPPFPSVRMQRTAQRV